MTWAIYIGWTYVNFTKNKSLRGGRSFGWSGGCRNAPPGLEGVYLFFFDMKRRRGAEPSAICGLMGY